MPWQFPFAGNEFAYRTQYWTRWLVDTYFTAYSDGQPGNTDYGTMSAWNVWACLGLYPLSGTPTYILSSPRFGGATLQLPTATVRRLAALASGDTLPAHRGGAVGGVLGATADADAGSYVPILQIAVVNASVANRYVASASINGVPLPTPFVNHSALIPAALAPVLASPDCASIVARGTAEHSLLCAQWEAAGGDAARAKAAAMWETTYTGPSVLTFVMSATPVVWGTGQPIPPEQW
jgi:hypothetical protein